MQNTFSDRLLKWYHIAGRKHLPWQKDITPYKVWLSEVMLQQTQVNTVIPYFEAFLATYPDVESLASAPEDNVMHLWSGLGYYSRARNLHRAAKMVVEEFNGYFPDDIENLQKLPGVGLSTAGAIRSSAFQKPAPILDGNVKRVLARHFAVEGWPGKSAVAKTLWQKSIEVTPKKDCRAYTQAIMDLGSLLCTRNSPSCTECPVSASCIAYQQNTISKYPGRKPKKVLPVKETTLLIIENAKGEVLLKKRPPSGIWGGLWSFPELSEASFDQSALCNTRQGKTFRHTFSHFHLDISPLFCELKFCEPNRGGIAEKAGVKESDAVTWYNPKEPPQLGLAAPVAKIIDSLYDT